MMGSFEQARKQIDDMRLEVSKIERRIAKRGFIAAENLTIDAIKHNLIAAQKSLRLAESHYERLAW